MRLNQLCLLVALCSASITASALAQAPAKLGYQGRLVKSDGTPETGPQTIIFSIFDTATGGQKLWTETQQLAVTSGFYATFLGDVTSLPSSLFDGAERWLEVSVGGVTLTPRQRIASVAYALSAQRAKDVKGGAVDATSVSVNGTQVIDSGGHWTGPASSGGVPAGAVMAFAQDACPEGWIVADGSSANRTTYAALFAAIGTMYGAGNGTTTFYLPDYRGQFLRGWAHGAATDPDSAIRANRGDGTLGDAVGTRQEDAFQGHNHSASTDAKKDTAWQGLSQGGASVVQYFGSASVSVGAPTSDGVSGGPRLSSESRPKNVAVLYCIKH